MVREPVTIPFDSPSPTKIRIQVKDPEGGLLPLKDFKFEIVPWLFDDFRGCSGTLIISTKKGKISEIPVEIPAG